jgi:hypothetical protein
MKLKNPLVVDAKGSFYREIKDVEIVEKVKADEFYAKQQRLNSKINENDGLNTKDTSKFIYDAKRHGEDVSIDQIAIYANKNGYDGVIIKNVNDNRIRSAEVGDTAISFAPEQIKSIHNKGTFSETNPNILMSKFKTKDATTKAEAQKIAKDFLGKYYEKHSSTLEIVQGIEDLPKDIQDAIVLSSGGKPRGVFNPRTGKAYLIADSMKANEVAGVLAHELLHKAINQEVKTGKSRAEAIMGSKYKSVVTKLDNLHKMNDPQVKEAFKKVEEAEVPERHKIEEVMTYLLENITNESKPLLIKWRDEVIQAIKAFIAKTALQLGIKADTVMNKLSSYDIANILRDEAIKSESILKNIKR